MNGKQYWKDKIPIFIINIVCMVLVSVFLFFGGNNVDSIAVILIIWTMLLAGVLTFTYHQRKRRLNRLVKMAEGLEEKYLLSEMLPEPEHAEEQVYFQLLKMASKSMLEQIGTVARERQEYREYIEQWIHEIKTPITSIIGYSELLLKSNINEEIKMKAYKYINSEAKRLETLNSTLLKLTLIREEKKSLGKLNLREMINGVEDILIYKLEKKSINLNINIEDVNILADKELFEVLLTNIIDNSIKASTENSVIDINGYYKNNNYILKLTDYGIGIPKEDLDKIIEPFYMVDKARTRKNNGIGLGLSICNEICNLHDISLSIESKLNMGTSIILEFNKENYLNEI